MSSQKNHFYRQHSHTGYRRQPGAPAGSLRSHADQQSGYASQASVFQPCPRSFHDAGSQKNLIVAGAEPDGLSIAQIMKNIPEDRNEQRRLSVFPGR